MLINVVYHTGADVWDVDRASFDDDFASLSSMHRRGNDLIVHAIGMFAQARSELLKLERHRVVK